MIRRTLSLRPVKISMISRSRSSLILRILAEEGNCSLISMGIVSFLLKSIFIIMTSFIAGPAASASSPDMLHYLKDRSGGFRPVPGYTVLFEGSFAFPAQAY